MELQENKLAGKNDAYIVFDQHLHHRYRNGDRLSAHKQNKNMTDGTVHIRTALSP